MAERAPATARQALGLRVEGLRSRLGGPFDLAVASATCLAISGRSGAGKSVLLRMIADLIPNDGEAWLDGSARSSMLPHVWRRRVGYVPANTGWWADRVADHFLAPDGMRAACARLLLPDTMLDAPVAQLSTGERQRLGLLRALEAEPDFLLLDEPCSGLDERTTLAVEALLEERRAAGLGMILVSHDMAQLGRMAQAHLHLGEGHLTEVAA